MSDDGDASSGDASELSEGEFAAYGTVSGEDESERGDKGLPQLLYAAGVRHGETLSPAALEKDRERDIFMVSHVRDGLCLDTAKELLIGHRWDVHRLLRAEEEGPARAGRASQPQEGEAQRCPVCQDALLAGAKEGNSGEGAHVYFTGCAAGPRTHAGHADCLAALAGAAIAHAAAGEAHRPGTVPCPCCVEDGAVTPGALTEAQVAALVTPEALALYRKVRREILPRNQRHCPAQGCNNVVSLPRRAAAAAPASAAQAVQCACGERFCFACGGVEHAPASCAAARAWEAVRAGVAAATALETNAARRAERAARDAAVLADDAEGEPLQMLGRAEREAARHAFVPARRGAGAAAAAAPDAHLPPPPPAAADDVATGDEAMGDVVPPQHDAAPPAAAAAAGGAPQAGVAGGDDAALVLENATAEELHNLVANRELLMRHGIDPRAVFGVIAWERATADATAATGAARGLHRQRFEYEHAVAEAVAAAAAAAAQGDGEDAPPQQQQQQQQQQEQPILDARYVPRMVMRDIMELFREEEEHHRLRLRLRLRREPHAGAGGWLPDAGEDGGRMRADGRDVALRGAPPAPQQQDAVPMPPPAAAAAAADADAPPPAAAEAGAAAAAAPSSDWIAAHAKDCPSCYTPCELHLGCQHVTCTGCGAHWCFRCRADWAAVGGYSHVSTCPGEAAPAPDDAALAADYRRFRARSAAVAAARTLRTAAASGLGAANPPPGGDDGSEEVNPDDVSRWVEERRRREAEMRHQFIGSQGNGLGVGGGEGGVGWDPAELEDFLAGGRLPAGVEARLRAAVAARAAEREARARRAAAAAEAARAAAAALALREAWAVRRQLAAAVGAPFTTEVEADETVTVMDEAAEAAAEALARDALAALLRSATLGAEAAAACVRARAAATAGVSGEAQAAAWRALASASRTEAAAAAAAVLLAARAAAPDAAVRAAPSASQPVEEEQRLPSADEAAAAAELAVYHRSLLEEQAGRLRVLLGVTPGYRGANTVRWVPQLVHEQIEEYYMEQVQGAPAVAAAAAWRAERQRAALLRVGNDGQVESHDVPATDAELMDACAMLEHRRDNFCSAAATAGAMARARLAAEAAGEAARASRGRKRDTADMLASHHADGGAAGAEALPASPRANKLPRMGAMVAAAS